MKDELKNESVGEVVDSPVDSVDEVANEESLDLLSAPSEEVNDAQEESIELMSAPALEEEVKDVEIMSAPAAEAVVDDKKAKPVCNEAGKEKIFQKFTSKDIVFLSIMAACMLVTSVVMPFALAAHTFGIIHLALGFQMSFFPALGLMKVRKPGALLYMTAVFSLVPLFIMPPVGLGGLLCALIVEALTVLIFRGYKKDGASLFASALFFPLGLPFMYAYYKILFRNGVPPVGDKPGEIRHAVAAMVDAAPGFAVGISIAVILLCTVGALLGVLTMKKLRKSGAIKK